MEDISKKILTRPVTHERVGPTVGEDRIHALLNGVRPGRMKRMTIGRNEPCPCGSGKKYKKCHYGKGPA